MDAVDRTVKRIKSFEIQGANKIAVAAIKAWDKAKDKKGATKRLKVAKLTQPMLRNVLKYLSRYDEPKNLLGKLSSDMETIAKIGAKKIRSRSLVFTHCHSSTISAVLQRAWKEGKKFKVNATETRPIYQGRITAKEMSKAGIPITLFVDAAGRLALEKADIMLIGADAITAEGTVINKIGSKIYAELAKKYGIPVYSCTHSWKFSPSTVFGVEEKIEEMNTALIWKNPPKGVKINSYAFEKVDSNLITGIISELGVLKPKGFMREVKRNYGWMFK